MTKQNKQNVERENSLISKSGAYCLGVLTAGLICMGSFMGWAYHAEKESDKYSQKFQIQTIESKDKNNEGLEDVVIKYMDNQENIFYNTGKGYQTSEQIKQTEIKRIGDSYQNQLRETNEFYQKALGNLEQKAEGGREE